MILFSVVLFLFTHRREQQQQQGRRRHPIVTNSSTIFALTVITPVMLRRSISL